MTKNTTSSGLNVMSLLLWGAVLATSFATTANAQKQLDIFNDGIPLINMEVASEFCQDEFVQLASCVAVRCPNFEELCPFAFVWDPQQDFGLENNCDALDFAFCTVYGDSDTCCMDTCFVSISQVIQCTLLAEDDSLDPFIPCTVPECRDTIDNDENDEETVDGVTDSPTVDNDPEDAETDAEPEDDTEEETVEEGVEEEEEANESMLDTLYNDFFDLLVLPVVEDTVELAQEACPTEFSLFAGCVALDCPNYSEVCPIPPTDGTDGAVVVSRQYVFEFIGCSAIERGICEAYETVPECCLLNCLKELNDLLVCVVNNSTTTTPLVCNTELECSVVADSDEEEEEDDFSTSVTINITETIPGNTTEMNITEAMPGNVTEMNITNQTMAPTTEQTGVQFILPNTTTATNATNTTNDDEDDDDDADDSNNERKLAIEPEMEDSDGDMEEIMERSSAMSRTYGASFSYMALVTLLATTFGSMRTIG